MRKIYHRQLKNLVNRFKKIRQGSSVFFNGFKIVKIKVYGKPAYMVIRESSNRYRVYWGRNVFQASHSVLTNTVYDAGCEKI
jgi:hypothetical protein